MSTMQDKEPSTAGMISRVSLSGDAPQNSTALSNIDENPGSPAKYGVKGIPTMILFKAGSEVDQVVGNQPKENIVALLEKHV